MKKVTIIFVMVFCIVNFTLDYEKVEYIFYSLNFTVSIDNLNIKEMVNMKTDELYQSGLSFSKKTGQQIANIIHLEELEKDFDLQHKRQILEEYYQVFKKTFSIYMKNQLQPQRLSYLSLQNQRI